jgi:hypothetical protein
LQLPDWVDERHIRIFAGIEEVARKLHGKSWQIKIGRCNLCGKCCMSVPDNWRKGIDPKTGWCKHLVFYANEYRCGIDRPFFCCAGDYAGEDYCSVKWETIE